MGLSDGGDYRGQYKAQLFRSKEVPLENNFNYGVFAKFVAAQANISR